MYRGDLLRLCYRMTDSVRGAEDVLQETLLAAWRGLPASRAGRPWGPGCTVSPPMPACGWWNAARPRVLTTGPELE